MRQMRQNCRRTEAPMTALELLKVLNEHWVKDGAELPPPAVLQRLKSKLSLLETEIQNMMKRMERIRKERHDIALELARICQVSTNTVYHYLGHTPKVAYTYPPKKT